MVGTVFRHNAVTLTVRLKHNVQVHQGTKRFSDSLYCDVTCLIAVVWKEACAFRDLSILLPHLSLFLVCVKMPVFLNHSHTSVP